MVEHSGKSGMYSYTDALCTGLSKIGSNVTVLSSIAWPEGERLYRIKRLFSEFTEKQGRLTRLHWAADRFSRSMINVLKRNRFALTENFDVMHVQGAGLPLLDQHFLKPLAEKIPLVLTVHDVMSHFERFVNKDSFMKRNLHIPHRLIVHYGNGKRYLTEHWSVKSDKIDIIPHGIMPVRNRLSTLEARNKLGLPADRKILLFFGSIRPNKGLDVLLKSIQEVVRYDPRVLLVITGALPRDESFQPYSDLIEQLNLSEHVKQFVEFIPDEEVDFFFSACDMVILPYLRFASQSGVLLRAYAHKKPVASSDVGAMGEIVCSDGTGEVAEPGNEKLLALSINTVLENLDKYKSNYTPELESKYDWEHIGRLTLQCYEKAIAQKTNR